MGDFSIFAILNTGVLGTYTSKLAMSITAHNIANANTPGFSRQRPEIHATPPIPIASLTQPNLPMMLGTGSMVKRVERVRDVFLDVQFREITRNFAYWDKMSHNLHYMEQLIDEPSEMGVRKHFDDMWAAFSEVMNDPLNSATIAQVAAKANTFVRMMQDSYNRFEELRSNLNEDIRMTVDQVNNILRQITDLNNKVRTSYIINTEPNDLLDERDVLLDRLNEIVGATYRTGPMGHLEVYVGNQVVVHGDHFSPLSASARPGTMNTYDLFIRSSKITVTGGHLSAIINLRDNTIPKYLDRFDEMALMLSDKMNLIHRSGFDQNGVITGIDFFRTMEATRTNLPNLFRLAGTNSIMSGPIHMVNATSRTDPNNAVLATGGSIGMVDLSHGLQNRSITTTGFTADQVFEDVIRDLNKAQLLSTQARIQDKDNTTIMLKDFDSYTGKAEIFYKGFETLEAVDGRLRIPEKLTDINSDGIFDSQDVVFFNSDGDRVNNFVYNRENSVVTFTGDDRGFDGTVRVQRWKSIIVDFENGEYSIDPSIDDLADLDVDYIRVFIETVRADSMHTDLGYHKMLLGRLHNGVMDQSGVMNQKLFQSDDIIQESLVNSLGNMRDLLMIDTDGLLARMGFTTKTKQLLEIGPVDIPANTDDPYWYYMINNFPERDESEDPYYIGFRFPVLHKDKDIAHHEYIYFRNKEELINRINDTKIVLDGKQRMLREFIGATFTQVSQKDVLVPTSTLIEMQGLEGLQNVEVRDVFDFLTPTIAHDQKYRSVSFTVPVQNPLTLKNENQTFEIKYRSRDELIYKINNNTKLNEYIKAFEHDGRFFIAHTKELESISNVVTHDEFNVLRSATLSVVDNESYKNLSNIMYSYNYATTRDFGFSDYDNDDRTVNLEIKSDLKDYNGRVKVQYAVRDTNENNNGDGYTLQAINGQFSVQGFDISKIRDINEDGSINNQDIKVILRDPSDPPVVPPNDQEINFRFDRSTNQIIIPSGVTDANRVDIVYWHEDSFNLNGVLPDDENSQKYTLTLDHEAVDFSSFAYPPSLADFKLKVQLPPDQLEMIAGSAPIKADMNKSTLTDLVHLINEKAPAGIQADLTPDQKLVFRAGRTMEFSFGKRLEDGRIVQMYDIQAPTIFLDKLGFARPSSIYADSWGYSFDVIRNYLDPNAQHNREIVFNALNIDGRQANGIYNYVSRLGLSSQLQSNPQLLAVDFGKRVDRNGDWIADVHVPRGGTNVDLISIMNFSRHSLQIDDGRTSFSDFFGVFVSEMGIEAETSMRMKSNNETMRIAIDNERERVKGVSLDEEMSNMIKYQHAFNAAARVITAVDQMIQRVIDGVGMVGR